MKRDLRFTIPSDRAGGPLIDFLAARFPYHPIDEWRERIAQGRVRINGRPATPAQLLTTGDELEYDASDIAEPDVDFNVQVIHQDKDILVLNKPPNLPCHPGGRYFNHTLWAWIKAHMGIETPAFVNRLDRETSGITLVALTPAAEKSCRTQFANRHVEKTYHVLVEADFPPELDARGFLVADPDSEIKKRQRFIPGADPAHPPAGMTDQATWAETRFRLLRRAGPLSEVEALPATGRMHQIRATLASLGYPVVGDKLYGVDPGIFLRFCGGTMTPGDSHRLRLTHQALHACALTLRHPRTRAEVRFTAPLPADTQSLLN
jgi:23S rRNA pseudouridine955/2504/2580 synthase/23S rRNA pseudouridine1911/1915/1917 synthase